MVKTSQNNSEHLFKVLVVGEASTGKTSFIKRYVHQFFSRAYKATIGVDFALKTLQFDENTLVRLQLWDLAGQERFGSMTRVYYKDAVGAFLVFDVNQQKTFDAVLRWKADLDNKRSQQDEEMLREFSKQHGFIGYLYTSPKDNINVEQAAKVLVREIMRRQKIIDQNDIDQHDKIVMTDIQDRRARGGPNSRSSCCS